MHSSKTTKRALLGSFTSLLLCFAMLIGSTFAWFTDTASTSVNTIQAGNLKVELLDAQGASLEGTTLKWQKAEGHENEDVLWEPGCTYSLQPITIKNDGNLALKYKIVITGINGSAKLNEVIDWTISVDNNTYSADSEFHLTAGQSNTLTISGTMSTTAGNEYQGEKIDGVAITVYATQDKVEWDSTTNEYDKDAEYDAEPWDGTTTTEPTEINGVYHITSAAEFVSFIKTIEHGNDNPYTNSTVVLDCNINLGGQTIAATTHRCADGLKFDGQNHTVSNFTLTSTSELYCGLFGYFAGYNTSYIKNVTIRNANVIGGAQVGVILGAVNNTNSTVENCKVYDSIIIGEKKVGAVAGYTQSGYVTNCYAENCAVYCADTRTEQAGEVVGFINTVDAGQNDNTSGNTFKNVTVTYGTTPTFVSSAAELKSAVAANTAKVSVVLTSDFTAPADWTPIDFGFYGDYTNVENLTINGNGHTISGLTSALVEKVSSGRCALTINDLTVKDADISNSSYTNGMGNGILVGYVENGNVTLNNCKVVDSEISESSVAAAALIGYASGTDTIKFTNCEVKNTDVAGDSAAGFIGYVQQENVTVSGCKVSGGSFTGERADKQGAYFGTVNAGATVNISNTTADTTALVGRILSTGAVNYN